MGIEPLIWGNFMIWIAFLVVRTSMVLVFKQKIETWIGHVIYGIILIIRRLVLWSIYTGQYLAYKRKSAPARTPRVTFPQSVPEIPSLIKLKPGEIVIGFDGRRAIRADLKRHHTIIGSTPGGGKTTIINSALCQLYSQGPAFLAKFDCIVVDLKADNENDYLDHWQPVLFKYYSVQEGNLEGAANVLAEILEEVKRRRRRAFARHIILFIDEIAMLTIKAGDLRTRNEETLFELAALGRNQITIVGATQNPHHKVMPTVIRHNFDRRICLPVTDEGHAGIIMGRSIQRADIPARRGDFIMYDPDRGSILGFGALQKGHAMGVRLPEDIDRVVRACVEAQADTNDPRIALFKQVASGLVWNEKDPPSIIGVANLDSPKVAEAAYRNYKLAGAFSHSGKRGATYKLAVPYPHGLMLVKKFIDDGKWAQAPEAVVQET